MEFRNAIKQRRLELGLTLEDVGKVVGVSKTTIQRWESGVIENQRRDKLELLAKALHISPESYSVGKPLTMTMTTARLLCGF